ncbi:MAG: hypothetical protein L6R48_12285 [Planctomycetes bacterium]|nr:hypothetical protein [Planctomycetota bacterium]
MSLIRLVPALLACLAPLTAAEVVVDAGYDAGSWQFHDGGEFPGAKGGLRAPAGAEPGVALRWDFTGGGQYVAATGTAPLPPAVTAVTVELACDQPCSVNLRIGDAGGRTFQGAAIELAPGAPRTITLPMAGPWASAWGGNDGQRNPTAPASVAVLVGRKDGLPANGTLAIRRLTVSSDAPASDLADQVATQPLTAELAGWRVTATWVPQWRRPLLLTSASGGSEAGELTISLPRPGRDWAVRTPLVPGQPVAVQLAPPLAGGGNPHAIYRLGLKVATERARAEQAVELRGRLADPILLGAPRSTRELPPSVFGTCLHLAYGHRPNSPFAGWAPAERLLDEVATLGLGWIRDGAAVRKGADGGWSIDPADLAWLKAAKARGLRTIVVLDLRATTPREEALAQARALAVQGREVVDVIELGNEPNNFGDWLKTYGGTWNGLVSNEDKTTARWVVEHLALSNALAEAIKAVRPEVRVIALGSPTPVNARALDLGLSPAIDGVVDHPYSFCLPPETLPFGKAFEKRDGVGPGDEACTFAGLVQWYQQRFAQLQRPLALWVTEFGWTSFRHDLKNPKGLYAGFTEEVQAAYLVRRHLLGAHLGLAASVQYDLLDDYRSAPHQDEANFGLLRGDYSRKPAWHATRRLTSLFAGAVRDAGASATVAEAPLHRAQRRHDLVKQWDQVDLRPQDGVVALPFSHPAQPAVRTLAVWSALPPSEFNGRRALVRVTGWKDHGDPVAIGLCSGRLTDVTWKREGDAVVLELDLDHEPLAVRAFAR